MKKVAIIGSGSAGAATALFLKGKGIEVNVFEKIAKPRPIGAGFMLQLTGLQVLQKLNLLDQIKNLGHPIHYINGFNSKDKLVLTLDFQKIKHTYEGIGIHRGTFFNLLHKQLVLAEIPLTTNFDVTNITQTQQHAFIYNQNNKQRGPFDLIIVANGASSQLREKYNITKRSKKQKWGAAWSIIPYEGNQFDHQIFQVYNKSKEIVGVMPIGKTVAHSSKQFITLFWGLNMALVQEWRNAGLESWKNKIHKLAPSLSPLTKHINSFDQVLSAPYYDVQLTPYHDGRIVFIGDAAHAMSPQLSCGVNNALLDAQALSEILANTKNETLSLENFYQMRKKHNQYYQTLCRLITPLFQSGLPLSVIRDTALGKASKYNYPAKIMIENALGIRDSFFNKIDPTLYIT